MLRRCREISLLFSSPKHRVGYGTHPACCLVSTGCFFSQPWTYGSTTVRVTTFSPSSWYPGQCWRPTCLLCNGNAGAVRCSKVALIKNMSAGACLNSAIVFMHFYITTGTNSHDSGKSFTANIHSVWLSYQSLTSHKRTFRRPALSPL